MEVREFAERVLFSTHLEEKLAAPPELTDTNPGPMIKAPVMPGRPTDLQFKPAGSGSGEFPRVHQLEEERTRGRLLHFFANHELLATELMALVLLRFPEAPAAFRRGVVQTLRDEQHHTRLYMERMKATGIHFGALPVSGYIWRCLSGMENPIDYVAGLSLTFEQANLDFARHFAGAFAAIGDHTTAALLDSIYRDEIAHVAYGLKWFRRWKNPAEDDWEAFCSLLRFPLSPRRARGFTFNVEGRKAAGLDSRFIAELGICGQSKGRTPGVFLFNPFAEGYIAQGRAFTPVQHQAQLADDLANLPQFLCRDGDIVLVRRRPAANFLATLAAAGFALPEFIELDRRIPASSSGPGPATSAGSSRTDLRSLIGERKLGGLHPWAWGPDSLELLEPLVPQLTGPARRPDSFFNPQIAHLYSKAWSANFLRTLLNSGDGAPDGRGSRVQPASWLCTLDEVGVECRNLEEAITTILTLRRRGHARIVAKRTFGLAGHNAIRLWEPEILPQQRRWMERALEGGNSLVIEPWLEREGDFSVQLDMTATGLKLRGYTGLINTRNGGYQGNRAAPHHATRLPAAITRLFHDPPNVSLRIHRLFAEIQTRLETALREAGYQGPVSIDAFAYRTAAGEIRLKPIVEINPRYTMGRLLVELMPHAAPGCHGLFRLINRAMARAEGHDSLAAWAAACTRRFPIQLEGAPVPRIRQGALCLNDPTTAEACLAILIIDPEPPPTAPLEA